MDTENNLPFQADSLPETSDRNNINARIAIARQYRRNIADCIANAITLATMTQETARSCAYALVREGKLITGPSVHLAKIIASCWGSIHSEAKVIRRTDKEIVSQAYCLDLETNFSASFEIARSIVDSRGKRFPEDIIVATGNAANSISFRNAVFAVVPKAVTDRIYLAAQQCITGNLSDADNLAKARTNLLSKFKTYKIKEEEIARLCHRQAVDQIDADEVYILLCILQSLKDGDTTPADLMEPIRATTQQVAEKKTAMKNKKKQTKLP